jgi:hypothetical protein
MGRGTGADGGAIATGGELTMPQPQPTTPIIFSTPLVRRILAHRKTMTRRIVKMRVRGKGAPLPVGTEPALITDWRGAKAHADMPDPDPRLFVFHRPALEDGGVFGLRCPYGEPGTILRVNETWRTEERSDLTDGIRYRAGDAFVPIANSRAAADAWIAVHDNDKHGGRWRSARFTPKWVPRIFLRVEAVRVEHIQEIPDADIVAEGVTAEIRREMELDVPDDAPLREVWRLGWQKINGPEAWDADPLVWCVTFSLDRVAGELAAA